MEDRVKEVARKHAIIAAYKYGRADLKAIIGKVVAEIPEIRKEVKKIIPKIREIVEDVNGMNRDEIEAIVMAEYSEMLKRKKEEKKDLDELPNAVPGKVKTRLAPEPNGYLHIGHAISFSLNYLYARKYEGSTILKLEDTNPTKEKPEFYAAILRDLKWLGIDYDEVYIISEHFQEIEKAAEELIRKGVAYVCTCSLDEIRRRRELLEEDPCREHSKAENLELWERMKTGERFVLRFRGDPAADNAVMRDPILYRVLDVVHPWTGENHVIYPTYDLANAFTDGKLGITHVLRSEEFLQRTELHVGIMRALGLKPPTYIHYGRFELEGTPVSKRKIRPLVEAGKVLGWDDPRLATIMALKRRGILPETLEHLARSVGLHRGKAVFTWDLLLGINRKFIDKIAARLFAVTEPVGLEYLGPDIEAKLPLYPDGKGGERILKVSNGDIVLIDKRDYEAVRGKVVRLKGLATVRVGDSTLEFISNEIVKPIIHWLPEKRAVEAEILVPGILFKGDGSINEDSLEVMKILVEENVYQKRLSFVQFERLFFARIEGYRPLKLVKV